MVVVVGGGGGGGVVVVVVVVALLPFPFIRNMGLFESFTSDPVAHQSLNLVSCFAAFSTFLKNNPFSRFRPSAPSAFVRIPNQCLFFSRLIPLPQSMTDSSPFSHCNL